MRRLAACEVPEWIVGWTNVRAALEEVSPFGCSIPALIFAEITSSALASRTVKVDSLEVMAARPGRRDVVGCAGATAPYGAMAAGGFAGDHEKRC